MLIRQNKVILLLLLPMVLFSLLTLSACFGSDSDAEDSLGEDSQEQELGEDTDEEAMNEADNEEADTDGKVQKAEKKNSGADALPEGFTLSKEATNYVDIKTDAGKHILIELYPDKAPKTVENFKKLVSENFYDGLIFHRIIDGFMIQGGGPEFVNRKDRAEAINGEFSENGFEGNDLNHDRGCVSMARTNDPNSASSQFFICNGDSRFLDGKYAAFGMVLSGMEEVDRIAKLPKDASDYPENPPVMEEVRFVEKN